MSQIQTLRIKMTKMFHQIGKYTLNNYWRFFFPMDIISYLDNMSDYLEKMNRIALKTFLSQIQHLRIKMTKIRLNVLLKEINILLYSNGKLIQILGFRVKGQSLGFRAQDLGFRV